MNKIAIQLCKRFVYLWVELSSSFFRRLFSFLFFLPSFNTLFSSINFVHESYAVYSEWYEHTYTQKNQFRPEKWVWTIDKSIPLKSSLWSGQNNIIRRQRRQFKNNIDPSKDEKNKERKAWRTIESWEKKRANEHAEEEEDKKYNRPQMNSC